MKQNDVFDFVANTFVGLGAVAFWVADVVTSDEATPWWYSLLALLLIMWSAYWASRGLYRILNHMSNKTTHITLELKDKQ